MPRVENLSNSPDLMPYLKDLRAIKIRPKVILAYQAEIYDLL
jgi:hypothetical protein